MQGDEILQMYVEEAAQHLSDIENDLLAIEESGADIDESLVNKVFRSVHSIKGGAGFMGLENIKDLSHKMENVLGMIRDREIIPKPDVINILLFAADRLRELINNVEESNEADISEHTVALMGLTSTFLPQEEKESLSTMVEISLADGRVVFTVSQFDFLQAGKAGKFIYLAEYDLIHDVHHKQKTPIDVLNAMKETGVILESKVDISAVGTLEDHTLSNRVPFFVLFASIIEPDIITSLLEVDEKYVYLITEDMVAVELSGAVVPASTKGSTSLVPTSTIPPVESRFPPIGIRRTECKEEGAHLSVAVTDVQDGRSSETSLRVHVNLLDSLMTLAGELVLGRNRLLQILSSGDLQGLKAAAQKIDLVTSELQEAIMRTRMQPIGNIFNKFPRMVRDLAGGPGKKVALSFEGKEVELDKTIIEGLSDPLTHLVRNAVDHGIELPEVRSRQGKDSTGRILLKAFHEAGQVNIEISDDGRGINGEELAKKAVSRGLITEEQSRTMSEKEKVHLIFLPGFSMAERVTDLSGRGVGMDVVKTNLDRLGGLIDIVSKPATGTRIRIKLPLTLAIIPSLLVSSGGERFAIPQLNLDELLMIRASQAKKRIEKVGNAEVVRLRGELLPLLHLADVLDIRTGAKDGKRESGRDSDADTEISDGGTHDTIRDPHSLGVINVAVVSAGGMKYGLVVDELHDSEEIVVKPLGRHLKKCRGYAGATIMGDGRVALILDVAGLAQLGELTSAGGTERAITATKRAALSGKSLRSLLIFRNAPDEQFIVPLEWVERVEEISASRIEWVGGKKVIQYRAKSLPVFGIEEVAHVKPRAVTPNVLVIVFKIGEREVGLLATGPVEAVDVSVDVDEVTLKQPGIAGSAVIHGHTALMVDIFEMVKILNPEWLVSRETFLLPEGRRTIILLAEDSNFFCSRVKAFIEEEGYKVITAEDGWIAWNFLQKYADEVSLVVTDIEMPNLDGYELTKRIKSDERFSGLPVIALTSLAGEEHVIRGKEAGVDEYHIKLDREGLMEAIRRYVEGTGRASG